MLKKFVNGSEVDCSAAEEAVILAEREQEKLIIQRERDEEKRKQDVRNRIGEPCEFLDKLCKKLSIDPAQKDTW